jgi:flagellar basal body-associated protein FliL
MSQSNWEAAKKKKGKGRKGLIVLLICIVGVAAVFMRNNSDLLKQKSGQMPLEIAQKVEEPAKTFSSDTSDTLAAAVVSEKPEAKLAVPAEQPVAVANAEPAPIAKEEVVPEKVAPPVEKPLPLAEKTLPPVEKHAEPAPVIEHANVPAGAKTKPLADPLPKAAEPAPAKTAAAVDTGFYDVSDMHCSLYDRPDLELIMSCKLAFVENNLVDELPVKRDDMRVMAKKVLREKALDEVVTQTLRQELIAGFNSVLTKGHIVDLIFTDFRIEKVKKQ